MVGKVLLGLGILVIAFLGWVASRPSHFHYERSGVIQASADKIFSYISDFKKGQLWNPYAQKDPSMKVTFKGPEAAQGSVMEFEGNKEVGAGTLTMLKLVPNQSVDIKLVMTSPMKAENSVHYELKPEGTATRFTWAMEGENGFIGKLFTVFIDCEKMISSDFEKGIGNLKNLVEPKAKS